MFIAAAINWADRPTDRRTSSAALNFVVVGLNWVRTATTRIDMSVFKQLSPTPSCAHVFYSEMQKMADFPPY